MQENADPGNVVPGNSRVITAALLAGAAVFAIDQWLKIQLFANAALMEGSWLSGLIRFTNHQNYGISFNLPVPWILMIAIAIIATIWAGREIYFSKSIKISLLLGIFIGGVLGNLFDRITLDFVRDWLLLWGRSAVNLADGAILVGLIGYLFNKRKA